MAFELPTDLIQQVQITLRTSAGISSYNPRDPTLPSLPPVKSTIAGIDPSSPYLRCSHCKGKLLRGLQSVICVYCGNRHKKDVKPDPIAFNSTFAYRWLLESLHFDGSEVVGPSKEGSEFNRSQNTPKEKISLSELLDLQIAWPDEPEEPEAIVTNLSFDQSKSTLNLSAVEFDDFFPGSERNNSVNASEEQPAVSNHQIPISGNNTFVNPKNLNLFQDVPPSESGIQSSIHASADSFTGWEADFQSTDARNQHEDSKPVDPIVGSAVDLSVHMDSVFGHIDHSNDGKLTSDSAPPPTVSDWIQDDQINNESSVLQQAPLFDSVVEAKNDVSSDNLGNKSSEIVEDDWFQDTKSQNSTVTGEAMNKDDDLFGEIINKSAASPPPTMVNDWIQDDLLNNIKSSVSRVDEQFKFAVKANDYLSPDYQNNKSSDSVDWFQDSKWPQNSATNMVNDDVDIFGVRTNNDIAPTPLANDWIQHDLLNNIRSSDSRQTEQFDLPKGGMSANNANEPFSDSVDWFQDNSWQANSDNAKDKTVKEEDDSFDEWNDFTSSTVNQDSSKGSWNQSNEISASSQSKPEMDLLMPTDNFQEVDFSGFYQSDPFSGSSSNAIGIGEVNYIQPEVSTTNRTTDAKAGENFEQPEKNADVSTEPHWKDDVNMLMSQMHDLSFILESNLSVPSKPDGAAGSFLHD